MDPDLSGLEAAGFLDRYGRFAKDDDAVATVRLFFSNYHVDLTAAEYASLSDAAKDTIKNSGSAAGRIDTLHKSNA